MKWTAISGSRETDLAVEIDVRRKVGEIMQAGGGIVAGGALGVDYFAVDEALKYDPEVKRIKIIIPTPLELYLKYFSERAAKRKISFDEARIITEQLRTIQAKNRQALIELPGQKVNAETFHARNTAILDVAEALAAFQVNNSTGTFDTITKAKAKGMPVDHLTYTVMVKESREGHSS